MEIFMRGLNCKLDKHCRIKMATKVTILTQDFNDYVVILL